MSKAHTGQDTNGSYLYTCPRCKNHNVYPEHIFKCGKEREVCSTCQGIGWVR